jgi:DNA processing protein
MRNFLEGCRLSRPDHSEHALWLALTRIKGLGCISFKKLASHFADPTQSLSATAAELSAIEGIDRNVVDGLLAFTQWEEVEQEVRRANQAGVKIIPFGSEFYPARLRSIADPPPCLYVKGEICQEDDKAVAVIGTRSASHYGRRVARDLCRGLVSLGFTVISGMARGIDGVAHDEALNAGGRTIAVLGSGVDRAYPPEHQKLYHRISESGAVISELPLGAPPLAFNFPARNRLISGLSAGVVVVEATEKSGSLITAAIALEQGREVFAVPGEVGSSRSRGGHRLIRQGAKLVESVDDILEEIAPQLVARTGQSASLVRRLPVDAHPEIRKIFDLLQERSLHIDEVIEASGLSISRVSQILLELELQGFLKQFPGNRYSAER